MSTTRSGFRGAEVAEIPFTAFGSKKKTEQVPGRLWCAGSPTSTSTLKSVKRQQALFDTWRFHAFFHHHRHEHADTVSADKTHRGRDHRTGPRSTIRRKLVTVPARIASSARRITLHLPRPWPWESTWNDLFNRPPPTPTT